MSTDPCGSRKCGDPAWIDRAMNLGTWGGAALLVVDIVVAVYLLVRRRRAFFVPLIGCIAQVALVLGAVAMELQAGPV
jgi:predicted RND superfamily exporter protein